MTNKHITHNVKAKETTFSSIISLSNTFSSLRNKDKTLKMLSIQDAIEKREEHPDNLHLVRQYERRQLKLGKRLAYLLRYGAEKEGCRVDEGLYQRKSNFIL